MLDFVALAVIYLKQLIGLVVAEGPLDIPSVRFGLALEDVVSKSVLQREDDREAFSDCSSCWRRGSCFSLGPGSQAIVLHHAEELELAWQDGHLNDLGLVTESHVRVLQVDS